MSKIKNHGCIQAEYFQPYETDCKKKYYKNNPPHHPFECSLKSKLSLLCFTFLLQSEKKPGLNLDTST